MKEEKKKPVLSALLRLSSVSAGLSLVLLVSSPALGEELAGDELADLANRYAYASLDLYRDLLAIPNDAHYPDHLERNQAFMSEVLSTRGFELTPLATEGAPLLLASRKGGGDTSKTVLVYLQIDGQPVDPSRWDQEDPWQPVLKEPLARSSSGGRSELSFRQIPWSRLEETSRDLETVREWRIFARSASDAKGPVGMLLAALDALSDEGLEVPYDLKLIMDFEEELGSPNLPAAVARHRDALAADLFVILDGPRHVSNRPTLTFGARGIATITLEVFGPRVPQHSGHYGNYAPNPAQRLARLLASMKGDDGRVSIDGFYDGVDIDPATREILRQVPDDEDSLRRELGIAQIDAVASTYQESIQYPSLNVRGMRSAWVGEQARTVIPASAVAEIDVRLVPESQPEELIGMIRDHVVAQGYHLVEGQPTEEERATHGRLASFESEISYSAFRTPYDSEIGLWLNRAMTRAFGEEPIRLRMAGGSIPISPFINTLGVPAVSVPTVNPDNNQHSPNENLRIGNYVDGVRTVIALLTESIE